MNARSSELKQQNFDSTALLIPFELLSGLVMNKQVLFFENIKPSVMKILFFYNLVLYHRELQQLQFHWFCEVRG